MSNETEYLKDLAATYKGTVTRCGELLFESEETKTPHEIYEKICELKNELEVYKKALKMLSDAFDYVGDSKMDEFYINKAKEQINDTDNRRETDTKEEA